MEKDYFYILLMSKANLLSHESACRAAGAVSLGLDGVLDETQAKRIFHLLPAAARPPKAKFYHRIGPKKVVYSQAILLERIRKILGLTGQEEAYQYLRAYLASAKILLSDSQSAQLSEILPPQLAKIYINL